MKAAASDSAAEAPYRPVGRLPDGRELYWAPSSASAMREAEGSLQSRVAPWMEACFGPEISNDHLERGDRLLEEVLELLQSGDYPIERAAAMIGYVWSRPKGEPEQEVGGVMLTLAAYCLKQGIDMHDAGEKELSRVWTKVEKIRSKQAVKPVGEALTVTTPAACPALTRFAANVILGLLKRGDPVAEALLQDSGSSEQTRNFLQKLSASDV